MRARWVPLKVNHAKSVVSKCRDDAKIELKPNKLETKHAVGRDTEAWKVKLRLAWISPEN